MARARGHGSVRLDSGLISITSHVMLTAALVMTLLFCRGRSRLIEGKWPTQVYKLANSRAKIFSTLPHTHFPEREMELISSRTYLLDRGPPHLTCV